MDLLSPAPEPAPWTEAEWLVEARASLAQKLRPVPKAPAPLPSAEPNHWPGTLLGVLVIICAGSLTMACAGLLGGGFGA